MYPGVRNSNGPLLRLFVNGSTMFSSERILFLFLLLRSKHIPTSNVRIYLRASSVKIPMSSLILM